MMVTEAGSPENVAIAALRAEVEALREEVKLLRWEVAGVVWASVVPSAAIVATFAETGNIDPLAVAGWVERMDLGDQLHPGGREAIKLYIANFVETFRELSEVIRGKWRPSKYENLKLRARLRVIQGDG